MLVLSCCRVILDGFSTFVVNSDGLIAVHKMDRVEPVTIVTSTDRVEPERPLDDGTEWVVAGHLTTGIGGLLGCCSFD